MKKLFLFLLISIFLMSLISAVVCTEPGYRYCSEYFNSYEDAHARARVYWQFEDDNGDMWDHYPYAIGNLYIKSGYDGNDITNGYGFYNEPSWSGIWDKFTCTYSAGCDISIFDFDFTIPKGRWKPTTVGGAFTKCVMLVAVDFTRTPNAWARASTGIGFLGTGNCVNIKVVECFENADCSAEQICDKTGDWTTWRCKTDPCKYITCEDKCQNSIRYYNGYCKDGECQYQTEICTYGCLGKLCAEDPCKGVLCEDKCENSIWSHDGHCVNGNCIYDSEDTCLYGCQNEPFLAIITGEGMCRDDPCVGVVCDDYCSETTLFYDGKCIGGQCVQFKEKLYAEECGFIPPPIPILSAIADFFKGLWDWIKSIFGG